MKLTHFFLVLKSKEIIKATDKLINDVATALLSRMMVDQEPRKVNTQAMNMLLNRLSPISLGTNTDLSQDGVSFMLSFDAITDEKAKDAEFVDILVRKLKKVT